MQPKRVAEFLTQKGFEAAHYHAGLNPETKLEIQQKFSDGTLRVIAATNAFGDGHRQVRYSTGSA